MTPTIATGSTSNMIGGFLRSAMVRLVMVVFDMWGWVEAALVEGMTAHDSLDPQPRAPNGTKTLDARGGIVGARRLESAGGADQTRQRHLVEANREEKEGPDHRPALGLSEPHGRAAELVQQRVVADRIRVPLGDEHDVVGGREEMAVSPKDLPHHALDAIPLNGVAHFLRHGDPESRVL